MEHEKKFKIKARGGLLITLLLINTLWCIGNQSNAMAKLQNGVTPPKKVTPATSEEKVKIAKQLYKDNPGKIYADAVKRAEANLAKEKGTKKK